MCDIVALSPGKPGVRHLLPLRHALHGTMGLIRNASRCVCASPVLVCHRSDIGLHCPLFFLMH
jgi:hypothetical protein